MRRQDVQIGVEYAETAALAYGREPRVAPMRVRFTDTRPGPWARKVTMVRTAEGSWDSVDTEIVHLSATGSLQLQSLPRSLRDAFVAKWGHDEPVERRTVSGKAYTTTIRTIKAEAIPVGGEVIYLDDSIKGGLPAERWSVQDARWHPTLVAPAWVHRTWSEVQAKQDQASAARREKDRDARIPEINALLEAVGLGEILRAHRTTGYSQVVTFSVAADRLKDGASVLDALQVWATDRRPAGWGGAS